MSATRLLIHIVTLSWQRAIAAVVIPVAILICGTALGLQLFSPSFRKRFSEDRRLARRLLFAVLGASLAVVIVSLAAVVGLVPT